MNGVARVLKASSHVEVLVVEISAALFLVDPMNLRSDSLGSFVQWLELPGLGGELRRQMELPNNTGWHLLGVELCPRCVQVLLATLAVAQRELRGSGVTSLAHDSGAL